MLGNPEVKGIFALAMEHLFDVVDKSAVVGVTCFEIYCNKLYDLFNHRNVVYARENAYGQVIIQGVVTIEAQSYEELLSRISGGLDQRTVGSTFANCESSRSHTVVEIRIKDTEGRLTFIDLAGSERAADVVNQDKQVRIDGAEINKSLLALKECIRAMDQGLVHQKFRGSKLTQVLKDSFIGNCLTTMIANISPSSGACDDTLNTLRYANRVKSLPQAVITKRPVLLPPKPTISVPSSKVKPRGKFAAAHNAKLMKPPGGVVVKLPLLQPAAVPVFSKPVVRSPLSPRNGEIIFSPAPHPVLAVSPRVRVLESSSLCSSSDGSFSAEDLCNNPSGSVELPAGAICRTPINRRIRGISSLSIEEESCRHLLLSEQKLVQRHRDMLHAFESKMHAELEMAKNVEAGHIDFRTYLDLVESASLETSHMARELELQISQLRDETSCKAGGGAGGPPHDP